MRAGMRWVAGLAAALAWLGWAESLALADNFTARDASTNAAYANGWNPGHYGGTGFGDWQTIGNNNEPNHEIEDGGFAFYAAGVLGRSFEGDVVLGTGTFKADALHSYTDRFSGFVLYGPGDEEIVRWGVTRTEDPYGSTRTGFWYAIDGGGQTEYQLGLEAEADSILQTRLDYSLTWNSMDSGKTAISLSVGVGETPWASVQTVLEAAKAVSAIGSTK